MMEYCHEIMSYIMEHEPIASTELARYFSWSDKARRQQIEALRAWGWIVPSGRVRSTEKYRKMVRW